MSFHNFFLTQCKQISVENQKEEIETIFNEEEAQNETISLSFEEDLSIYKEAWTPSFVQVDGNGFIYIISGRQREIYIRS